MKVHLPEGALRKFRARARRTGEKVGDLAARLLIAELDGTSPAPPPEARLTLESALVRYRDHFIRDGGYELALSRGRTWHKSAACLSAFKVWAEVDHDFLDQVTDLWPYRERLSGRSLTGASRNKHLRVVSGLFSWAMAAGHHGGPNPVAALRAFPVVSRTPEVLERAQVVEVLREAGDDEVFPLVAAAALAGLRRSEIVHLRPEHVDLARKVIRVVSTGSGDGFVTKGRRDRTVPLLFSDLLDVLRPLVQRYSDLHGGYLLEHRGERWKDTTITRHVTALSDRLPFDVSLQSLRRTWVTICVKDLGYPAALVQQWAGHRSLRTTADHYVGDLEISPAAARRIGDVA